MYPTIHDIQFTKEIVWVAGGNKHEIIDRTGEDYLIK